MKKIFLTLFVFVLLVVGIPLSIIALMYDGSANDAIPIDVYQRDDSGFDLFIRDVEAAFNEARNDPSADLEIALSEDILNLMIYHQIIGDDEEAINANYAPGENCQGDQCYILEERFETNDRQGTIRLNGLWVTFEEGIIVGNAAVEFEHEIGFTFRTRVRIQFSFEDDLENDRYVLAFDRVSVGRIPLTRGLFTSVMNLVNRVTGGDAIESDLLGIGTLNVNELELVVKKQEFVEFITSENGSDDDMTTLVLTTVFENDLITLRLVEEAFIFNIRMSLLRNIDLVDIPSYLYDLHGNDGEFDANAFNVEQHLQTQFDAFVFNLALTGDTVWMIHQRTFNKVIYYALDGFNDWGFVYEYEDENDDIQSFAIDFRALWFDFAEEDDGLVLSIRGLIDFNGIPSRLEIRAEEISSSPGVYAFEFTEISMGKEPGKEQYLSITNMAPFKNFLRELDEFPFGSIDGNGNLLINTSALTNFIDDGAVEGAVSVRSVAIVAGGIRIEIEASDAQLQAILDDYANAINAVFTDPTINTALQNNLDTVNEGPEKETFEQFVLLQSKLENEEAITEDDIEALFDNFEQMSSASQEAFMNAFKDLIDPNLVDQYQSSFQD